MNSRLVDPRTIWAVLAMEAALALPLMSLPTQGDRIVGLAGPVLLLILLPAGYAAVYLLRKLRDPSWRLLTGMGLALLTRLVVSVVPDTETGLVVWFGHSVIPAAVGVALWWRGGALAVAELTPAEVRTEFSVVALCLVATLALVRPFILPDALLLGGCVGMFAIGGLAGMALSRQDAAEVAAPRFSGALAAGTALTPAVVAVVLVGTLRPELLRSMWQLLARAIELLLTPIGLLFAWLESLFPQRSGGPPPTPPPLPAPPPVDPATLANAQDRMAWLSTLIIVVLLLAAALAALVVARLLLENWVRDPRRVGADRHPSELEVEASGTPTADAANAVGWLMRWLRSRFRSNPARQQRPVAPAFDAWAAYQRLLSWAEHQGLTRHPAETTGQLAARLAQHAPDAATAVHVVTSTYEWERYGGVHPANDRLVRVREAVETLTRVEPRYISHTDG